MCLALDKTAVLDSQNLPSFTFKLLGFICTFDIEITKIKGVYETQLLEW